MNDRSSPWQPHSWINANNAQPVLYRDNESMQAVVEKLKDYPPLVTIQEIKQLKNLLSGCAKGEYFLLQGGDCAESFDDCKPDALKSKLKILLQMSLILLTKLKKPIIRIGRIAGQYAKPRTQLFEIQDNLTLTSYRGNIINGPEFSTEAREPDPDRMLQAYHYSALTLNYIRALLDGGFAHLENPENWTLNVSHQDCHIEKYEALKDKFIENIQILKVLGGLQSQKLNQMEFFTSHEALHLHYEETLTRLDSIENKWYNLGTHFPWIGLRTLFPKSAHVEYARGISNPLGIKIGTLLDIDNLLATLDILDPTYEQGKLTLIHRYGVKEIEDYLPKIIQAVTQSGHQVVWCCDPMHGNTILTRDKRKTRFFKDILYELQLAIEIHQNSGQSLNGVHFELTGEDVTECIGGSYGIREEDLNHAYKSLLDPRLNYHQALEMAFSVADLLS